jgi:hypothetical protein
MIAVQTITKTITVRERPRRGKLKRVIDLLEWRNWQTHGTQKPKRPGTQRQSYDRVSSFPLFGNPWQCRFPYKPLQ